MTVLLIQIIGGTTLALLFFAAGAAYGGRHASQQSRRADRETRRADSAERNVALLTFACEQARVQLHDYRAALGHRAGRKAARP